MAPPDLHVLLGELAELAGAAGATPRAIAYGSDPEQVSDLLMPATGDTRRVAVLLHGGFWRARFGKSIMEALAIDLVDRGWATWNVEYRRVGNGGGVPETLDDVRAAVTALGGVQPPLVADDVVVIGHSAGGQLGLCLAAEPAVTAVVSLAGVCDLATAYTEGIGDQAVREFMGAGPRDRPDAYRLADPVEQIPVGKRVLLVHGDADDRVPVEQSRRYAQLAAAAGDTGCELLEFPGVDHFALIDPRTAAWATVAARLETMVA